MLYSFAKSELAPKEMSKNHCSLRDQGRGGRGGQTCVLSRDKKRNDSSRLIALLIATPSSIPSVRRRKPLPRPFPWRQKSRKRAERDSLIIFTGGERWFASSAAILTWLPRLPRGKMSSKEEVGFCIILEIYCAMAHVFQTEKW